MTVLLTPIAADRASRLILLLAEARAKQGGVPENLDSVFDSADDDLEFDFDS